MARKPIIGITVAHCTEELKTFPREFYVERIKNAGGQPLLLPPVQSQEEAQDILSFLEGIIFTGGGDIAPVFLGEQPKRGIGSCIPERDQGELLLAWQALQSDLPVLGICRGIQVLAVAAGGRIYQDIRTECPNILEHSQTVPREFMWHEVNVLDSQLKEILGGNPIHVNSFHHQAVSVVPEGFIQNAVAPDGIIEGIEKIGTKFCIGVQWHPETLKTEEHSRRLFESFVQACKVGV